MSELAPVATMLLMADHERPGAPPVGRPRRACTPRCAWSTRTTSRCRAARSARSSSAAAATMLGYWNRPDETAEALRGGWMHTGDGGYMDDDSYVFVVDRIKDMIITGGENVYSIEVENVISQHPSIATCAVIGLPDDKWGERVHAVVVLQPGAALDLEELQALAREHIAGYKIPRSISFTDALPMSAAGKVLKRELRVAALGGARLELTGSIATVDLHLADRVAVVTGASKGIGLAITRALVAEGAKVVAGARSITDELAALSGQR